MKKFFISLVALMAATLSYAQSSMMATLSHEGEISTFYGAQALREAHEAAENGDVITLSSGSFLAVDITKGITIRGAGMWLDPSTQQEPTVITGDFTINIPEETTNRLTIEGIYNNNTVYYQGELKNATFIKDRFATITSSTSSSLLKNATFIHCKILKKLYIGGTSSVSCVNCLIWEPGMPYSELQASFEFINCNLCKDSSGWRDYMYNSTFKNCIFMGSSSNSLNGSNTAFNCIRIDDVPSFFENIPNTTNTSSVGFSIFKNFNGGSWKDDSNFELTDEAKEQYKGLDDTEVGMYGGNMPFDITPTNPQITKCNVAAKSTADGKLSVDITVNGAE